MGLLTIESLLKSPGIKGNNILKAVAAGSLGKVDSQDLCLLIR